MPELRKDPVLGRWVIISVERGKRPADYTQHTHKKKGGFCPFCQGNEYTTPPEIMATRPDGSAPNGPGWTLRVMPNKFPMLSLHGELNKKGEGIYDRMAGFGSHEVIVETPDHNLTLSSISQKAFEDALWAYHSRIGEIKKDKRNKYILLFKNEGEAAGATLEHSYTQIISLPIVPRTVKDELAGARRHFELKERCLFCDIINQEHSDGRRVVMETDAYIAIAPFASRSPFETWILPKEHAACFGPAEGSFAELAMLFQSVLRRMDVLFEMPAYNFMLHIAPLGEENSEYYHWHFEIIPKLARTAGFEWGSGFYINQTTPEEAAKFLREAKVP